MVLQTSLGYIVNPSLPRDKSFADDLNTEQSIVSGRVTLLLRSAEIRPLFTRFVLFTTNILSLRESLFCLVLPRPPPRAAENRVEYFAKGGSFFDRVAGTAPVR